MPEIRTNCIQFPDAYGIENSDLPGFDNFKQIGFNSKKYISA